MSAPSVNGAAEDRKAGRLWLARDRLESYVAGGAIDQDALAMLGDVLFDMGDHPRAARYWMLTARDDPRFDVATAALQQRYPRARQRLAYLRVRAPLDAYPDAARRRIEALAEEARADDGKDWEPATRGWVAPRTSFRERVAVTAVVLLVLATLIAGVVQLVEIVVWLVERLLGR